jgi:hypothetical protein
MSSRASRSGMGLFRRFAKVPGTLQSAERGQSRRPRRSTWSRVTVEGLEERLCLSTLNYTVMAQSGQAVYAASGGTSVGTLGVGSLASINSSGNVAFLGVANGFNGAIESNGAQLTDVGFTNRSLSFPQIDDNGDVIAQDQAFAGATLNTYIRIWQANGNSTIYASGAFNGSTGGGDLLTIPSISPDGTQVAYQDKTSSSLFLYINGQPAHAFPAGAAGLREMIANNGAVVVQDGNTTNSPIMLFQLGNTPVTIASSANFSALGNSPGISSDGQVVGFYGVLTSAGAAAINAAQPTFAPVQAGPGIFASVSTASHGRVIVQVAVAEVGSTDIGAVSQFDVNSKVGANAIHSAVPGGPLSFLVGFTGTDAATGNDAVYCNRVDVFGTAGDPKALRANVNTPIAEVGDTITGISGAIQSVSLYDPVNNNGQVAFLANYSGGSAVVVAQPTPISAVTYYNQGPNAVQPPNWPASLTKGGGPWANAIYANGPVNKIQKSGCALTALTMAVDYLDEPTGDATYDPGSLNYQLLHPAIPYALGYTAYKSTLPNGHVNGNDIIFPSAAADANPSLYWVNAVSPSSQQGLTQAQNMLTSLLQQSDGPVIVAINGNSHFILVTGKVGDEFQVLDPGNYQRTTLSASSITNWQTCGYLRTNDPIDVSRATFVVEGGSAPVDLLVTAPGGQQSGIDPTSGNVLTGISGSAVFSFSPEDTPDGGPGASTVTYVDVFQPSSGSYQLAIGGTSSDQPYSVTSTAISSIGTGISQNTVSGVATSGNVTTSQTTFASFAPPVVPPEVSGILVGSSSWSPNFLEALQSQSEGDGTGYAVPVGSAQSVDLPWTNLNQIQIRFNENVDVQIGSLSMTGINVANYSFSGFAYNANTYTATWTLSNPISADRVSMDLQSTGPNAVTDSAHTALDGEWTNGVSTFPSGNGTSGGDFSFSFNVLPGDVAELGIVNAQGIGLIGSNWLETGGLLGDANGDGIVNAQDLAAIASHWLNTLPTGGDQGGAGNAANGNALMPSAIGSGLVSIDSQIAAPHLMFAVLPGSEHIASFAGATETAPRSIPISNHARERSTAVREIVRSISLRTPDKQALVPSASLDGGSEAFATTLDDDLLQTIALSKIRG